MPAPSAPPAPSLHAAVSGWLLGPPSGANHRLLALLAHLGPRLTAAERITVLHGADFAPPSLPRIEWQRVAIPAGPAWRRARAERAELPALLRRLGANVLDHGFLPLPPVPVPVCLLLHDVRDSDGHGRWPRWFGRWQLRAACAAAAAVVVPSAFTAARVAALAPGCSPIVIPNAVAAHAAPDAAAGRHRAYLLHIGHLEARKNLDVLLHALARLPAERRPDLVLVGRDAGCASRLRRLAERLGIAPTVHWRGVLPDAEVAALTAAARAIVVPSRYEGFGLPALEGLASGRPTLVAAAGALPEVVGDQGTCLPPDDAAAWAGAIDAAAADAPGAGAARRARAAMFTWPPAAARLLALWRTLAGAADHAG